MRYETLQQRKDEDFKRLTGVSRMVFEKMQAVLQWEMFDFGRPPKSGEFRLPGKKVLEASDTGIDVALIDATEQTIERPQKSSASTTAAKRSDIP